MADASQWWWPAISGSDYKDCLAQMEKLPGEHFKGGWSLF